MAARYLELTVKCLWQMTLLALFFLLWQDYRAAFWTLCAAGPIEYMMHWGPMHHDIRLLMLFRKPHADHHVGVGLTNKARENGKVVDVSQYRRPSGILLIIPISWIVAGILAHYGQTQTGIQIAVTCSLYVAAYEIVHAGIHAAEERPNTHWFEAFWLFQVLMKWHQAHHKRSSINYGVLLGILLDLFFGTREKKRV